MAQPAHSGNDALYEELVRLNKERDSLENALMLQEAYETIPAGNRFKQEDDHMPNSHAIGDLMEMCTQSGNIINVNVGTHIHRIELFDDIEYSVVCFNRAERVLRSTKLRFVDGTRTGARFDDLDWAMQSSLLSFMTRPITGGPSSAHGTAMACEALRSRNLTVARCNFGTSAHPDRHKSTIAASSDRRVTRVLTGSGHGSHQPEQIASVIPLRNDVDPGVVSFREDQGVSTGLPMLVFETHKQNDASRVYQITWPWPDVRASIGRRSEVPITDYQMVKLLARELAATAQISEERAFLLVSMSEVGPRKLFEHILVPYKGSVFAQNLITYYGARLRFYEALSG